jgi:hypothetical protein
MSFFFQWDGCASDSNSLLFFPPKNMAASSTVVFGEDGVALLRELQRTPGVNPPPYNVSLLMCLSFPCFRRPTLHSGGACGTHRDRVHNAVPVCARQPAVRVLPRQVGAPKLTRSRGRSDDLAQSRKPAVASCLGIYHAAVQRNKRCVLAYLCGGCPRALYQGGTNLITTYVYKQHGSDPAATGVPVGDGRDRTPRDDRRQPQPARGLGLFHER